MENLEAIRTRLVERKAALEDLLGRVENSARRQFDKSLEEQAIQRENEEVLTALDNSLNREYFEVQMALERMDNGDFGNCYRCGAQISPKRLEALPHTDTCIDCAS